MSDDRLTHLEARFAWLERHATEQDRAMVDLADDLRRLKEEVRRLRARATATPEAGPPEDLDEKPPHY
jgi:SlyX protein